MKKFSFLLLVVVLMFGLTFSGCNAVNDMFNKLFGKGQAPVVAPQTPSVPGGPITESGYLNGPGSSYTFTVNAGNVNYLEVPFTYPKGQVKFWVKVVGQDGSSVLGDFDLDNGEVIQLSGGGTFYLTVYSKMGAGELERHLQPHGRRDDDRPEELQRAGQLRVGISHRPRGFLQIHDQCRDQ